MAEDGCLSALRQRLEETQYHAVLLSMHGTEVTHRDGRTEPALLFEAEGTWRQRPVAGSELAQVFDGLPGGRPGLIVLAACRSAKLAEAAGALQGVALELHQVGLERVLGMRLSVLDQASSVFTASFFGALAHGAAVGRALSLTRREMASGTWFDAAAKADPFAQWSLPVLYERTTDGPLVAPPQRPSMTQRRPRAGSEVLGGDRTLQVPRRASFIGRPASSSLGQEVSARRPWPASFCVCFESASLRRACSASGRPSTSRCPSSRSSAEAFDGADSAAEARLQNLMSAEPERRKRLGHMLNSLARRKSRPCAFLLDNLESLQDVATLKLHAGAEPSLWFVKAVCALPEPTLVLLTGRDALPELANCRLRECALGDAPWGDVLRRMNRLEWPSNWSAQQKRELYGRLGGNHRALEWLAHLLSGRQSVEATELLSGRQSVEATELLAALEAQQAPPETPQAAEHAVLEAMRQNLLLDRLVASLGSSERELLRRAVGYRVPVTEDGLLTLSTDPSSAENEREALVARSLVESALDAALDLDFYEVPPLVRSLLGQPVAPEAELRNLHERMARYHEHQGAHVTRRWTDDIEAVHHYRRAGLHLDADRLAEAIAGYYYGRSAFSAALELVEEIVTREAPPPPWWALNRAGMCRLSMGNPEGLALHERALACAPDRGAEGATLNNLSQIYNARGDYETAQRYLEQSLTILREIGDKAGEGATLNNLSQIYNARGDYETAQRYLEQSLTILREIGDKAGMLPTLHNLAHIALQREDHQRAADRWSEALRLAQETGNAPGLFHVARDFGSLLVQTSNREEGAQLLRLALQVGQDAGFPGTDALQARLAELGLDGAAP